jgi:D-serine deaminase-like pyridoxal phosphate-dependent protein
VAESDALVGRGVGELDTPMPVIDLDVMEANIRRLADYARGHGIALWPHAKTHKIPAIAALQLAAGAGGITVAKPGEAEVMAANGIGPLLIHYPCYGAEKWQRIAGVIEGGTPVAVAIDSFEAAEPLAAALAARGLRADVLIELDVGQHRTGVRSPEDATALATRVDALEGLAIAGISCFPGHVRGEQEAMPSLLAGIEQMLSETVERLSVAGLRHDRVSGGGTPAAHLTHLTPTVTELRAGTYVFLDRSEVAYGPLTLDDCALRVHTTVVSVPEPGRAVIDAGSKTLSDAVVLGPGGGFGAVPDRPDVTIRALNEEHGYVELDSGAARLRVGDRLAVVPNHVCACVNLHDVVCGARGGVVEAVFEVAARGRVR